VRTLHVSGSFSDHNQEFSSVHSPLAHVITGLTTACMQDQDRTSWSCMQAVLISP